MRLNTKHLLLGVFIGVVLLMSWIQFWPLGQLKIIFCDVGQGDAIYIRFPTGQDMLVDGGPNNRVLNCLGSEMPFYDRKIDLVALTHPQKDHLQGLIEVLKRYEVGIFISTIVGNHTESFLELEKTIIDRQIPIKKIVRGNKIKIGEVLLATLWPDTNWLNSKLSTYRTKAGFDVLGYATDSKGEFLGDPNTYSLYFYLQFRDFDLLLTGDGDISTQSEIIKLGLLKSLPGDIEVLKVPHHGAVTALNTQFIDQLKPDYAVIQVGKNSYGHPRQETLDVLMRYGQILRNDIHGKIKFMTDGYKLWLKTEKN